jgi:HEAT repeat protein
VPALAAALNDRDIYVRRRAADVLGKIGPAAVEAVPG